MDNFILRILKYTFVLFFVTQVNSFSDEFNEIMDSINDIKEEYNSLPKSKITEANILDEAIKELNQAIDFANITLKDNDVENTLKTLEYVDQTLSDVSKIVDDEISRDMSDVKLEELDEESTEKLVEITNSIKEKNEKKISNLVSKMIEINDKGLDTFSASKKIQNLGIETLGSNQVNIELEKTKLELEKSKKEYEELKSSAPAIVNNDGIKDLSGHMSHALKEIQARDKVKKLSANIKSIKEKNIIYNLENKPKNYEQILDKSLENFEKDILDKKAELENTKKEYEKLKNSSPPIVNSQGIKDLTSHMSHALKEIQARDKVKKLSSQIETLKETTKALKIKDIDALKDINNPNFLKGRSILVTSSITGLTQMGVIINSSRNSNVVTYMPSLYGIGTPQTAILIGNSKVKELATSSIEEVKDLNKDLKSLSKSKELKKEVTKEIAKDVINVVKLQTRDFAYNVTRIENEIAEIKELAKEGTVDLESKAKELGFTSFAEGVEAYNKQNKTNYTVDEAKEALGVK